jgi:teichuronic acid biosynthesis glycosyltransferase TuaH
VAGGDPFRLPGALGILFMGSERSSTGGRGVREPADARTRGAWRGREVVVVDAANGWDVERMADRQLASALAAHAPIVYVDPSTSFVGRVRHERSLAATFRRRTVHVSDDVVRLSPEALPGATRPRVARLNRRFVAWQVRRLLRALGVSVGVLVEANLMAPLVGLVPAARTIYWAQDDFVGMAPLIGVDADLLAASEAMVSARADAVVAANPEVARTQSRGPAPVTLIPFGCDLDLFATADTVDPRALLPRPVAFLMGTINERLDVDLLRAVSDAGISLVMIGPRSARFVSRAFDELVERPGVTWIPGVPFRELPPYLAGADVGLVPYTLSRFNVGSYPLKTFEYLAAGLPVVATDLPALRMAESTDVRVCADTEEFVAAVRDFVAEPPSAAARQERRAAAAAGSWAARAAQFAEVIGA